MKMEKWLGFHKHVACLPKICWPVNGLPYFPHFPQVLVVLVVVCIRTEPRLWLLCGFDLHFVITFRARARASASDEGREYC